MFTYHVFPLQNSSPAVIVELVLVSLFSACKSLEGRTFSVHPVTMVSPVPTVEPGT